MYVHCAVQTKSLIGIQVNFRVYSVNSYYSAFTIKHAFSFVLYRVLVLIGANV
jgi:hypothetical protein